MDVLAPNFESIPDGLKKLSRWLMHHNKIPQGKRGRVGWQMEDAWFDFESAKAKYLAGGFTGVGVITGDTISAIDLDHGRDPITGELKPWAQAIVEAVPGPWEVSLSGTGLHLFGYCQHVPGKAISTFVVEGKQKVEIFHARKFVTVTGNLLPSMASNDLTAIDEGVQWIVEKYSGVKTKAGNLTGVLATPLQPQAFNGESIIEKFNATASWADTRIFDCGWTWESKTGEDSGHITRPGKESGTSGTLGLVHNQRTGTPQFYCFTSSDPTFPANSYYDKFELYAVINHGGNKHEAAVDLASKGYGSMPVRQVSLPQSPSIHEVESGWVKEPVDPGEFPANLLNVPGLINAVTDYNLKTAIKPQPVLALGGALALLSVITGRKIEDEFRTRSNLYIVGIADSGRGKERARQVNNELLEAAGAAKMVMGGVASHSGLISALYVHPARLFQFDEIGRMLQTLAKPQSAPHLYGIITNLMKLYTSAVSIYHGDAYSDEKMNKVIHQPHCVVYGTSVAESVYSGLTKESITDGFIARCSLFEASDEQPVRQIPKVVEPEEFAVIVDQVKAWCSMTGEGNLSGVNPVVRKVSTSEGAKEVFKWLSDSADEQEKITGKPYRTLWTRTYEKARKFALLYAASEGGPDVPEISRDAAFWGCELSWYLTERLIFLASKHIADSEWDRERRKVLSIIHDAGPNGIGGTPLCRLTRWLKARDRMEIINALEMSCDIKTKMDMSGKGPAKCVYQSTLWDLR